MCFEAGKRTMKGIYRTVMISIVLLFSVQTAHAVLMPEAGDGNFYTIAAPGSAVVVEDHDTFYVSWFQFSLTAPTDIALNTIGSNFYTNGVLIDHRPLDGYFIQVMDTVLALYDYSFQTDGNPTLTNGNLLAQNDDCPGGGITSCLSFSDLAAGSYLAGITLFSNRPFEDDWETATDNGAVVPFLVGTTHLNIISATVNPVPVPAAIWLFGSALIGFVGMSRKRSVKS